MRIEKSRIKNYLMGVFLIALGLVIFWRGRIWSLVLADERFIVGSLPILAGIYAIYLTHRNSKKA
jgi:sulfite exporter TauE/SafE